MKDSEGFQEFAVRHGGYELSFSDSPEQIEGGRGREGRERGAGRGREGREREEEGERERENARERRRGREGRERGRE